MSHDKVLDRRYKLVGYDQRGNEIWEVEVDYDCGMTETSRFTKWKEK